MLVLIAYDINTETAAGRRRLRKVAKLCEDRGQRVQNSLFECLLDPGQKKELVSKLISTIDENTDSLRLYNLGKNWQRRVEHIGAKPSYDPEGLMMV